MARTEPIRDPEMIHALLSYYENIGQHRNNVLLNMGVYTALRIGDILRLNTNDVYEFITHNVCNFITIKEQKTGKTKTIALHPNVKRTLELYFHHVVPNSPLILNEATGKAITRGHAFRLIAEAAVAVRIPQKVSCHSLRKTFGYHAWKNGTSPVVLMEIFNHSSYNITKRYLGVTQDDQNEAYLNLSI